MAWTDVQYIVYSKSGWVDVLRLKSWWVADITYIRFDWRFIYLAVILDAYTRAVRGWA